MAPTCKRWPVAVEDVWQEWRENWSSRLIPVLRLILAPSLLAAWKLNLLSRVPKCHCPLAPVVQVVVDDEGCVVEGCQQVRHGCGARLVAPAEGRPCSGEWRKCRGSGSEVWGWYLHSTYLWIQIINMYLLIYIYIESGTDGICDDSFIL